MNKKKNLKTFGIILVLISLILLGSTMFVRANSDNNSFLNFDKKDTSRFGISENIISKIENNGISFLMGQNISITNLHEYILGAGKNVDISKADGKDYFLAGSNVNLSNVKLRDVYIAGQNIKFDGEAQNLNIAGEKVTINGKIKGDVNIDAKEVNILDQAKIEGKLKYNENAKIDIKSTAQISQKEKTKEKETEETNPVTKKIKNILFTIATLLLSAIIIMLILPKAYNSIAKADKKDNLLKLLGIGILSLTSIPLISLFFMLITFGYGAVPGLIVLVIYAILIFLSPIFAIFHLGNRFLYKYIKNQFATVLITLVIYTLLTYIPFIGGFIVLLAIAIGLGLFINRILQSINSCKNDNKKLIKE